MRLTDDADDWTRVLILVVLCVGLVDACQTCRECSGPCAPRILTISDASRARLSGGKGARRSDLAHTRAPSVGKGKITHGAASVTHLDLLLR